MAVPPAPPVAADPLDDPHSALATRSVYFDFDKALIEEAYIPALVAHGGYLGSHPARRLRVEGNCDERGGREYNLALGQRRADAVAQRLTLAGAQSAQIEAISYGKERPKALGHDEAAWTENRRADLVYH
jgi:peptidoglycan-associated lipoprotein